ncbi:hypothetical protein FS749_004738, partial [Ceratobasidium sp. UAMH 11750]
EFAKCRRCRKAKYCGKECQSKAWAEGHRFWCSAREEDDTATVVARREPSNANGAPAAVATEVEVPRRGLTGTVTRALVNIAGITGRAATPAAGTPGTPAAPQTRTGTGPDAANRGAQTQTPAPPQPARGVVPVPAAQAQAPGAVARPVAGARVVRPVAVPAGTRAFGTTPPANGAGATGTNWTAIVRGAPTFTADQAQPQGEAGPSRRPRGPETARRRSGTMPSANAAPTGGGTDGGGWRVVPVERVSPTPSAPHTTPLQTGRMLEPEDEMMVE